VGETLSIHGAHIVSGWLHVAALAVLALAASRMPDDEPDAESIGDRIALMRRLLEAGGGGGDDSPAAALAATMDVEANATQSSEEHGGGALTSALVGASGRAAGTGRREPARSASGESREVALGDAAHFGVLGALATVGRPPSAASRWSTPGNDGAGTATDVFYGSGGDLGLSGIGEGSGDGSGSGIPLGSIGTLGHDVGSAEGTGGMGGWGGLGGHHVSGPVVCGCDEAFVNGRLPPEAIQRVVRQNMGRFRYCYERALDRNPALQGRVVTRFLIARNGSVGFSAQDEQETEFPDPGVVSCIVQAFGNLSFPEPEGGTVTVVYPLTLTPSG
jgi:hypothetical protein